MLFMVIEAFRGGAPVRVGERFRSKGRMLPPGVSYVESWMTSDGARCFQLMEAPDAAAMTRWVELWEDLVAFDVIPVVPSKDFWTAHHPQGTPDPPAPS